ncbi:MAG: M24 family metallopeptidase [Rhodospirillales bacterium]
MHFTVGEYDARLAKVKASMAEQGIDVLLSADPANMCYLTGYDGWSFYVPQCVIVALSHPGPIWVGRGMDANAAKVTTRLPEADIVPYPDDYVQNPAKHAYHFVADLLKSRGLAKGVIATEMDADYFTARAQAALVESLPDVRLVSGQALVNRVRIVKSAAELAIMRQAAMIAEKTMQTAIDHIRPGVRQCDAAAEIYKAQISGTTEFGGDYTAICPLLPTGRGTSTPHLTFTDAPFVRGEATIIEIAGARLRYHVPMARTVHLGPPPPKLADTAQVVVDGLTAALDAVKPGMTCEEVEAAWRAAIAKSGLVKESRLGYSIGLNYPPDWGEKTASLRPGDRTILEPGMCFHMIPGIWLDDWGVEISEAFRVTETGAETFCNFPRKLFVTD